jgi:DNA polymerase III epsilon subunit-like protein
MRIKNRNSNQSRNKNKNKMTCAVLDLETTGLGPSARIVSIAWIVLDANLKEIDRNYYLVQPEPGYFIPEESIRIHGITTEKARQEGIPLHTMCYKLGRSIYHNNCKTLVSHNVRFDVPILLREIQRAHHQVLHRRLKALDTYCTMLKGAERMGVRKWPKLINLYKHLFDMDIAQDEQHHALYDCANCARIYCELMTKNEKLKS